MAFACRIQISASASSSQAYFSTRLLIKVARSLLELKKNYVKLDMEKSDFRQKLLTFLHSSPTPFHVVNVLAEALQEKNFVELKEENKWDIKPGKYFLKRNGSSIIAFQLGEHPPEETGLKIVGAHTDSPGLKLKPTPIMRRNGLFQLGVEVYGGALLNPWFDRDLSIAGRITKTKRNGAIESTIIDAKEPLAFIPSLAIHLDREANKNKSVNAETDIVPIISSEIQPNELDDLLAAHLKKGETLLSTDLFFYDTNQASFVGARKEFLAAARLDNQLSCFCAISALLEAEPSKSCLVVLNDHEEVGSASYAGADGSFLLDFFDRISENSETRLRTIARSLLVSTDNAHAVHPNYPEKHEKNHGPIINNGIAIKHNANQRYATNSETAGYFKRLCLDNEIPFQEFVNRGDMSCGSTIGPITASKIGVRTLDLGVPTFGMHSIRELAGIHDIVNLGRGLKVFFNDVGLDGESF